MLWFDIFFGKKGCRKKIISTRNNPAFVPKWNFQASGFVVLWNIQERVGLGVGLLDMIITDGNFK